MTIDRFAKHTHRRGVLAVVVGLLTLPVTTRAQPRCAPRGAGCTLLVRCCDNVECILSSSLNPNSGVCAGVLRRTRIDSPPVPDDDDDTLCDPSYPDFCLPPATGDTLNCEDIPYTNFRVLNPDPHNFDDDDDGIGCVE